MALGAQRSALSSYPFENLEVWRFAFGREFPCISFKFIRPATESERASATLLPLTFRQTQRVGEIQRLMKLGMEHGVHGSGPGQGVRTA